VKPKPALWWVLVAISALTALSGLVQAVSPGLILGLIGGDTSAANRHSFGIVGMFMVLFGGLLLQALLSSRHHPLAVFWAGLQKLGAAGAVGLGVGKGLFSSLAWAVAGFDLLTGVLIFFYLRRIRGTAPQVPTAVAGRTS